MLMLNSIKMKSLSLFAYITFAITLSDKIFFIFMVFFFINLYLFTQFVALILMNLNTYIYLNIKIITNILEIPLH